ncbi:hypothetical protein STRIP9103_07036 [Streptomyces ipomoeae 91-03]|uniref:Uncharacterized protein n=1 Tax=Streptomyces ipomoeae 91-03 TaxID=698759 RepID=L1KXY1_9ACTN|nr:hypothetical protein STRIP9103_07036 [Streptomyces ipomoeae 91-03]
MYHFATERSTRSDIVITTTTQLKPERNRSTVGRVEFVES